MTKLERLIVNSPPVSFLARKSKKIILPGFEGLPLYDVIVFFLHQVRKVGFNERAAAISFNLLMAIPPLMIFLFTLVPYMPIAKEFNRELLLLVKDITPNQNTYRLAEEFIRDFTRPRGGLLSFGFLLIILFSSNAMIGIMRSFDRSLHTVHKERRNFFKFRWTAIRLTSLLIVVLIACILLLIFQGNFLKWLFRIWNITDPNTKALINSIRWLLIVALFFLSIGLIYRYAPAIKKKWKIISPGTILATFLIVLVLSIFSFWIRNFGNMNRIYGSIGTVLILMSLIFISSLVLLIGFELNVSINTLKMLAEQRGVREMDNDQHNVKFH